MNNDLFQRVLVQLQPELAQEFGLAILEDAKKLKALEIIKEKPETLYLIPTYHNYDAYLELALDIALIEEVYSPEEFELLKEVIL